MLFEAVAVGAAEIGVVDVAVVAVFVNVAPPNKESSDEVAGGRQAWARGR